MPKEHPSNSRVQGEAEKVILRGVGKKLGVKLRQSVRFPLEEASVIVDGATEDELVLVEVYARVGKLKGGQPNKVLADATKLLALKRKRPKAKVILAFADQTAADSIVGWRAAVLESNKVEKIVIKLSPKDRKLVEEAQTRQRR
jgi:hypothetical protein